MLSVLLSPPHDPGTPFILSKSISRRSSSSLLHFLIPCCLRCEDDDVDAMRQQILMLKERLMLVWEEERRRDEKNDGKWGTQRPRITRDEPYHEMMIMQNTRSDEESETWCQFTRGSLFVSRFIAILSLSLSHVLSTQVKSLLSRDSFRWMVSSSCSSLFLPPSSSSSSSLDDDCFFLVLSD